MDRGEGDPGIQLVRKLHQVFRVVEQGKDQDPEQTDQDGHLHYQRAQTTDWVHPAFAVEPHGLLGDSLTVALVTLLDFADPGLHARHGAHLPQLTHSQGYGRHAYQRGEHDDGNAHLGEAEHIQHQQGVEHGPNDHLVPNEAEHVKEWGEEFHLCLPVAVVAAVPGS